MRQARYRIESGSRQLPESHTIELIATATVPQFRRDLSKNRLTCLLLKICILDKLRKKTKTQQHSVPGT